MCQIFLIFSKNKTLYGQLYIPLLRMNLKNMWGNSALLNLSVGQWVRAFVQLHAQLILSPLKFSIRIK